MSARRHKRRAPRCKAKITLQEWPWKARCYEEPGHAPPHVSAYGVRWSDVNPGQ